MWVQFVIKPAAEKGFILEQYQVDGEEPVSLPESVSTPDTISYVVEKARMTEADILDRGTIRINMKMTEFQSRISSRAFGDLPQQGQVPPSSLSVQGMMCQLLTFQQQQAQQQQEFLRMMTESMSAQPRLDSVKPEVFDGSSASPKSWIDFFEYACEKNHWTSDDDKIKNLRPFLQKMAKSWYELRILQHATGTWQSWKESFLTSFEENAVDRWDKAISFKYQSGSPLEYFFEKRKLLQMADANLPDTSIIPLVMHGMSRDLQRQVQVRNPKKVEDLMYCCKELFVEQPRTPSRPPGTGQGPPQGHRFGPTTSWGSRGQYPNTNQSRVTHPIYQVGDDANPQTIGIEENIEKN